MKLVRDPLPVRDYSESGLVRQAKKRNGLVPTNDPSPTSCGLAPWSTALPLNNNIGWFVEFLKGVLQVIRAHHPATSAGLAAFSTSSIRALIRPSTALSFRFRRFPAKLALKRTFHVRPREWRRLHFG